ncbi:MAG: tetratricopeptide repeat protein, partial [Alphaproteobacteria bacterium]|nr:tetratricopeptide repeat protein [Alphaproteobacteria bacterium]
MSAAALARFSASAADGAATGESRQITTERLVEAVGAMRDMQRRYTREAAPQQWAMLQNNLGNALRRLGERENRAERIEEAAAAYRAALEIYTRTRAPLEWAMTQNNLGAALRQLGERETGTARLE